MAILGKDLLDLHRPHTNTRVEFGASCYWVESTPKPQPYGAILTEVLNLDTEPLQHLLDGLNAVIQQRDLTAAPCAYLAMKKGFGSLPLYRLYLEDVHAYGDMEAEDVAVGGAQEAFAEFVVDGMDNLPSFMQHQLDDIRFIQKRYTWFLDTLSAGRVFEKKKGQRKIPLARQITNQFLEPFVSGVSLGENRQVDAPQVNIQYAVLEQEGQEPELVEKIYFDRLLDFVYVELMRGMQKGFVPKRCANCGRWFLQYPGATYAYCDRPAPGQKGKTCREIGATVSFQDKVRNNDVWKLHQRAYKKYFARTRKGTMGKPEFEKWARIAEQLRDQALTDYEKSRTQEEKNLILEKLKADLNYV